MKKIHLCLYFILLICVSTNLHGQEPKFIEITTADTIVLNPVKIIYEINLGMQDNWMGLAIDGTDASDIEQPEKKDIEDILQNKRFKYTISEGNGFMLSAGDQNVSYLIELENVSELKNLLSIMNGLYGLTGGIKEVLYEPSDAYYKTVYTSLYTKAKEQASILAEISGTTLGGLISATDIPDSTDSYLKMMETLYEQAPFSFFQYKSDVTSEIVYQMRFRFEIK